MTISRPCPIHSDSRPGRVPDGSGAKRGGRGIIAIWAQSPSFVGRGRLSTLSTDPPESHSPNRLCRYVLLEAVKRIDQFCEVDCHPQGNFLLALDEHVQRAALITEVSRAMYGAGPERRRHLIEPLFNLESHRYQTIQAADWIAAPVGRIWCYLARSGVLPGERDIPSLFRAQAPSGEPKERNSQPTPKILAPPSDLPVCASRTAKELAFPPLGAHFTFRRYLP